jgi:hypothetical protein
MYGYALSVSLLVSLGTGAVMDATPIKFQVAHGRQMIVPATSSYSAVDALMEFEGDVTYHVAGDKLTDGVAGIDVNFVCSWPVCVRTWLTVCLCE